MNAGFSRAALFVIVAAVLLATAVTLSAQTKTVMRYKEVHYPFSEKYLPMGDPADGRVYGVWDRRGLFILETGEVGAYEALGDFEASKTGATISGQDTWIFDDGSTWVTKFEGQVSSTPKGLWVIPHKGEFVKGTGRFEGIKGSLVYTSRQINKTNPDYAGFAETEGTATYTLPSK